MRILVIGSGGREHAIADQLAKSPQEPALFFAPGNPGMTQLGQRLDIDVMDLQGLLLFAQKEHIDLTVVGPEAPLAAGIVDLFQSKGLLIFGPNQKAAQLEASKAFAKQLMQSHQIPTAGYRFCLTQAEACEALTDFSAPYVIKEDGLAAGKGVTIAATIEDAEAAIERAFDKNMPVVIEEFLTGEELSVLAVCDGQRAIAMVSAQDFKRVGENNTGPNTGGMGAYAPVPLATPEVMQCIQKTVLDPMMRAFLQEDIEYRGILYAGLMIDNPAQPKVVEFNVRFGDPETEVLLPLLDEDLVAILKAAAEGDLSRFDSGFKFKDQSAVTVVMASKGYPGDFEKGFPITFPDDTAAVIYHAGTKLMPDQSIVTAGGRVLNVVGMASSIAEARQKAYQTVQRIACENLFYRTDIAESPSQAKALR